MPGVGLDYHALTNGGDLQLMDELFYPEHAEEPAEIKRKRWLCHAIRHPLEIMFATIQAGLVDDRTQATASLSATLRHLVLDDMFLAQVEDFSSDNGFIDLCHRLRKQSAPSEEAALLRTIPAGRARSTESVPAAG